MRDEVKRTVRMSLDKETKGTVRYAEEEGKDQMLVTLYIRKTALETPYSKVIRVMVEEVKIEEN